MFPEIAYNETAVEDSNLYKEWEDTTSGQALIRGTKQTEDLWHMPGQ